MAAQLDMFDMLVSGAEELSMKPDRLICDCVSVLSDLVQLEIERFPAIHDLAEPRDPDMEQNGLQTMVTNLPYRVKSSIRTLSEDAWSVFQSVTSLAKYRDGCFEPMTTDESDSCLDFKRDPMHVYSLKRLLGSLRSRSRDYQSVSSEGDQARGCIQGLLTPRRLDVQEDSGRNLSALRRRLYDTYKAAQDLRVNAGEAAGTRAGEGADAMAGELPALKSLSKVLSELDGLLALLESDYRCPELRHSEDSHVNENTEDVVLRNDSDMLSTCIEKVYVSPKADDDVLRNDSDLQEKGKETETTVDESSYARVLSEISVASPESAASLTNSAGTRDSADIATSNMTNQLQESGKSHDECSVYNTTPRNKKAGKSASGSLELSPGVDKSTEKRLDIAKEKKDKLARRGKLSDSLVKSKVESADVPDKGTTPKRNTCSPKRKSDSRSNVSSTLCLQCMTSKCSGTSLSSLSVESRSHHTFSKKYEPVKKKTSSPKRSAGSVLPKGSSQAVVCKADSTATPSKTVTANKESQQELLRDKSKSDTKPSRSPSRTPSQKRKRSEISTGSEDALPLERRSSAIDLQACQDETVPPHVSAAQWDMIPTTTISCPNMAASPGAGVREWSSRIVSSHIKLISRSRQKGLAYVLYSVLLVVSLMAVFHITMDFSYAPFSDYAGTLIDDLNTNVHQIMKDFK